MAPFSVPLGVLCGLTRRAEPVPDPASLREIRPSNATGLAPPLAKARFPGHNGMKPSQVAGSNGS